MKKEEYEEGGRWGERESRGEKRKQKGSRRKEKLTA